ncbi:hypothetical protein WQQ_34430 [Hydrocarboniphaga effusa AP103]|uniref:Uncharacterized protein n=1 Tax=Hydrocarboniphaga effusa AP103 TaxID=1172194 RepID=I8I217_9GAMM|nr:hypothetical protein WQQ_34430 [Hydrocarboniphaga effusa AP103]
MHRVSPRRWAVLFAAVGLVGLSMVTRRSGAHSPLVESRPKSKRLASAENIE